MTDKEFLTISNNQAVDLKDIPEHNYQMFWEYSLSLMKDKANRHCVNYFGYKTGARVKLFNCIADDTTHQILILSTIVDENAYLQSFTQHNHCFEKFEREIHENFGIMFLGHPWLKPARYAQNRVDKSKIIANYPFYQVESEELHEVGVGPIHAGIIEPGHFRFICNGEQILHLEIQLGYQHRGIEQLMLDKKKLLERTTLVENIAGDTTVGHTTAFVNLWESLCGYKADVSLQYSRTLAQEMERIAVHTGDLSAICTDIAYQLGSSVFGRLRTPIINFFQEWGGNRLAKGLIRAGKINYPFSPELAKRFNDVLDAYEPDFFEMCTEMFKLPSALSRLEQTGIVTYDEVLDMGTVGMAARMSGLNRDIRASHPYNLYNTIDHKPIIKHHGDVYSRAQIRKEEVKQSLGYIRSLLKDVPTFEKPVNKIFVPAGEKFVLSLLEGWRGEICHCAITDKAGELVAYKIKDPSHHNWMALAQAVRNNDISDFPICNKSFNLSYCGHDL